MTSSKVWSDAVTEARRARAAEQQAIDEARERVNVLEKALKKSIFDAALAATDVTIGDTIEETRWFWKTPDVDIPTGRRGRVVSLSYYGGGASVLLQKKDGTDGKASANFSNWRKVKP